ncbi:hypothetical protein QC762_0002790 [Podospora pseudocomata]|uniref:Mitochondrial division protein 1 n=1 Tax=Podospora pseudocomata TaxID=2093779 RepID=A0ABR0GT63_9PEZI|nr:hypothetical protein QC762_0002790 [Podospora pseudocomata]
MSGIQEESSQVCLRTVLKQLGNLQTGQKDEQYLTHLQATDPRHDKKNIELRKGGLLRESYCWVLSHDNFHRWRDNRDGQLLWVRGDPGKGKTMLLCGIIDELEKDTARTDNIAFFFCQATDDRLSNATAVLRGLIYLLVTKQQPELISHVRESCYGLGKEGFQGPTSWVVLSKIFTNILEDPKLRGTYLIIDALDECTGDRDLLLDLIASKSSAYPKVKWLVSSRNWPDIEESLNTATQKINLRLELNEESVSAAVTTYIQSEIDKLAKRKKYNNDTRDAVKRYLDTNAHGTFLWVALVCQELAKISRWEAVEILTTFPPGLDAIYEQMRDKINKSRNAKLLQRILAVISVVYRPITLNELPALVDMPDCSSGNVEDLIEIVGLCGSFLILRQHTISFVHQSAKDFLLSNGTHQDSRDVVNWVFPQGKDDVHNSVFSRSLSAMSTILHRDIYGLKLPGFPINGVQTPCPDPLATVRYSCVFWVDHLRESISDKDTPHRNTLVAVQTFLEQKYLYWLEALSLLRAMSKGVIAIRKLEGLLGRTHQRQLTTFIRDAHRFALSYRWIIEQAPLQAYTSALVFAPLGSLMKKRFKTEEPSWISVKPVVEADWNACLQTLEGHRNWVTSVAFSADGQRLASGSDDHTVKIWDPASGQCLQTLQGHSNSVTSIALSADGQRLASGSHDRTVKIWDPASGQCLQTLQGHSNWVTSVAFSADGQRLASGSHDRTVKIWDPASGQCLQTLQGHSNWVNSIAFSADGQRFASGSYDRTVKIWDPASGQCLQTLQGHSDSVTSVAFSADGQRLASGSDDHTVKIWDPASGQCLQTLQGHSDEVNSIVFSADDLRAHGYRLGSDKTWVTCNGQNVLWLPPEYRPTCSVIQGRMVAIGCSSGRVFTIGFSRDI